MITQNRTRTVLTLAAVAMAILVTTTHQVSAAVLTHDATVEVMDDENAFDVSVFPGKASYSGEAGAVTGVLGDGTVLDYRFFNNTGTTFNGTGYADGGAGLVSEATATNTSNLVTSHGGALDWADVWTTNDPGVGFSNPANFTIDTIARSQGVSGTIDISGLQSGTLYFIYGTYENPNTVALTMSGPGQPDVLADHTEDPPLINKAWISSFDFSDAAAYDTISYTYTNTDTDGSRARFMGVILDGVVVYPMNPSPADKATDVLRDVVLSWTPGQFANTHDVYFGTVFGDINDADRSDPRSVLVSEGQIATTYAPGRLDLGQTYFWRIDEVNAPPDSTIFKGEVWSFTTEPIGYPIENVTATASSSTSGQGPENTVNGFGLDANDMHSTNLEAMWLSDTAGPQPTWIQYEFDKVYKLHQMWVWNHNGIMEQMVGVGFKDVSIEYSVNGTDYTTLGTTHEFAQAPGAADYEHNTTVDFGGTPAKFVRLTANSNWVGFLPQYGLSEVRFLYIPVQAREPSPDSSAADVDVETTLSWRAGREAAKHDVYLSTDEQAVIDGTAPVNTVTEASYSTSLDVDSTYYWRVDEVNDAETPTTWQGEIWNFTTPEYLVVDDFELYNDLDPGDPNSNRIFNTWIDGYGNTTNGSVVGYDVPPFAEQIIVHGGEQAMPFLYSNTGGATYSEAERTFAVPQDWTKGSPQTLVLYLRADSLSEALDTTFSFTTDGSADWFSQAAISYHDGDAAQSGDISDNQESLMQTTVSGAGTASFYWKVSSEADYDFLEFYIDGELQDQISGTVDWQQMTYAITGSGSHTLEWRYTKDEAVSEGSDNGWVDKLEWNGGGQPANMSENTGQLYVKVNEVKVDYPGNVADIQWMKWNIDLASLGVDLQDVTTLAIGIEGDDASGTLYFDDFRLESGE